MGVIIPLKLSISNQKKKGDIIDSMKENLKNVTNSYYEKYRKEIENYNHVCVILKKETQYNCDNMRNSK